MLIKEYVDTRFHATVGYHILRDTVLKKKTTLNFYLLHGTLEVKYRFMTTQFRLYIFQSLLVFTATNWLVVFIEISQSLEYEHNVYFISKILFCCSTEVKNSCGHCYICKNTMAEYIISIAMNGTGTL